MILPRSCTSHLNLDENGTTSNRYVNNQALHGREIKENFGLHASVISPLESLVGDPKILISLAWIFIEVHVGYSDKMHFKCF